MMVGSLHASYLIICIIYLQQTFESAFSSGCVCPGDTLIYECTVMGGGSTVWTGSAFNCLCCNNEIPLLHSRFKSEYGTNRSCNNGSIVGQSLSIDGNNYTSQLNVTITPEIVGKTVTCISDNGTHTTFLFSSVISLAGPSSAPQEVNLSRNDYLSKKLTFSWSPVAPDCPAVHYNILASNCGSCPTTTNHTTVTCTDEVSTNDSTCTFAVQTVVCGNITGNVSDPISIIHNATEPTRTSLTGSTYNSATTEVEGLHSPATNIVYIISFSSVATALVVGTVVFISVMVIILKTSKANTTAVFALSNRVEETIHNEPVYEIVTDPLPSVSIINTQDNVAYGCTRHQ